MRLRAVLLTVVIVLALLLVATLGVSFESAESLVHPARDTPPFTPQSVGLLYRNVSANTTDGIRLVGWWIPAPACKLTDPCPAARSTVVFLHGYGQSKNQSLRVAPFLHRAGYNVLAMDFRAHGQSGGDVTTVGLDEVKDVDAMGALVPNLTTAANGSFALFGWSMGAATALNAAPSMPRVRAIVADSPFATLDNIASNSITHFTNLPKYPFGPLAVVFAGWIVGHSVEENRPIDAARGYGRPVLIVSGTADTIAYTDADARPLAQSIGPSATLWIVPGAMHVGAIDVQPANYSTKVTAFLNATFPAASP